MAQQFFDNTNNGLQVKTIIDANFTELYTNKPVTITRNLVPGDNTIVHGFNRTPIFISFFINNVPVQFYWERSSTLPLTTIIVTSSDTFIDVEINLILK